MLWKATEQSSKEEGPIQESSSGLHGRELPWRVTVDCTGTFMVFVPP